MINRIISAILAFLVSVFAAIFGTGSEKNKLVIELESNASTGYSWICEMNKIGILVLTSEEYVNPKNDPPLTGAPGKQVFTFTSVCKGEVELTFTYQRSWEKNEDYAKKLIYTCSVDENGVITILDIQEFTNETV
jgi:predicted secreted protein